MNQRAALPQLGEEDAQEDQTPVTAPTSPILSSSTEPDAQKMASPARAQTPVIGSPNTFYRSPVRSPRLQQQQQSQQQQQLPIKNTMIARPVSPKPLSPPAKSPLRAQKVILSPPAQPSQLPSLLPTGDKKAGRSVKEEIEASLAAAKVGKKAEALANAEQAVKPKDDAEAAVYGAEDDEIKDQTPAPSALAGGVIPSSTTTSIRKTTIASGSLSTAHINLHTNPTLHQSSNIPPSPIFSSFLSSNPNRTSALSFVGLPGRFLGGGGHAREKSLGLAKSLGTGMKDDQDKDHQGVHSQYQNTYSALSSSAVLGGNGKKRLSSAMDGPEPQSSATSAKVPRFDSSAPGRPSTAHGAMHGAAPLSKEEATKQRLDLLRSRISNIKGSSRTSSASSGHNTAPQAMAVAANPSAGQAVPASRLSAAMSGPSAEATADLLSPLLLSASAHTAPPFAPVQPSASTLASSATSAFASAVAAFVPAPSFGASFASLFGSSKPAEEAHQRSAQKDASSQGTASPSLYPSLPSMTNLALPNLPGPPSDLSNKENDLEILQDHTLRTRKSSVSLLSPRRSSAASVQSLVSSFEAKHTAVGVEKAREKTVSPVVQKWKSSLSNPADSGNKHPANYAGELQALKTGHIQRSTTPPFSPPLPPSVSAAPLNAAAETMYLARPSLPRMFLSKPAQAAGELQIEDPDVEPIARAPSAETEVLDDDDADADDGDEIEDGELAPTEEVPLEDVDGAVQGPVETESVMDTENTVPLAPAIVRTANGFKPKRPTMDIADGKVKALSISYQCRFKGY